MKALALITVALVGTLAASWSRQPDTPQTQPPGVYSIASVKLDYITGRLEWEVRRAPTDTEPESKDLYYVDLSRGLMGHAGVETPLESHVWKGIVEVFGVLETLAVEYTKVWYGTDQPPEQQTESPALSNTTI
jgi:hypothetical protein